MNITEIEKKIRRTEATLKSRKGSLRPHTVDRLEKELEALKNQAAVWALSANSQS